MDGITASGGGAQPEILGIGHCCQDSICQIEAYPPEDGSTHITQVDDSQGGGAVGTALVAAARLGARVGMVANLGQDTLGDQILEGFRREGVDVSLVHRVAGGRSPSSIVMVNPANGSRTKFPCRNTLPALDFTQALGEALGAAKLLHLDGTRYGDALRGAELGRALGLTISLDGCSMQPDNEKNRALLRLCDIVITNKSYPKRLTGLNDLGEALAQIAALGPRVVATTLGDGGCAYLDKGRLRLLPAFPVAAVDTTGAGDTFHGAFLAHWLVNPDTQRCLWFAGAAAALKCLAPGGRAGIPTWAATQAFLDAHEAGGLL